MSEPNITPGMLRAAKKFRDSISEGTSVSIQVEGRITTMAGRAKQQSIPGVMSPAHEQAQCCIELRDGYEKAKARYDEEVEELLGLMHSEGIEYMTVSGVTFRIEAKEKLKIEGYKKPVAGE